MSDFFANEFAAVRRFHRKIGFLAPTTIAHLTQRKLKERIECLEEELKELRQAVAQQDLVGIADALVDLDYFVKGTAVMMGLPWDDLFADVHFCNMAKERGVGKRGHAVDAVKPLGWAGPATLEILQRYGYNRENWLADQGDVIDEAKCLDDLVHLKKDNA